jgi:Lipoprotein LpqB beta-propeller domain/Sporulation and spore germination
VTVRRCVAAVGALALLGGCAQLPTSGPVEWVVEDRADSEQLPLIDPAPPQAGAAPAEIVTGFYEAMKAYPLSTDVAQQYLTADAAGDWYPLRRTIIYDTMEPHGSGDVVYARYGRRAELSARGSYRPVGTGPRQETYPFQLRLEAGEWRIVNPPDALYVDSPFFTQYYQPVSLYFVAPSGEHLVPDPIYLPTGEQLPTNLLRGLLAGPTPAMSDQVQTFVPPMIQTEPSVPVDESGVADVRLSGPILEMGDEQLRLLAAQVVCTLTQVTNVGGVRITVSGVPLEFPGIPAVQTAQDWSGYDASAAPARGSTFALDAGRIVQVTPSQVPVTHPTPGWWGRTVQGIDTFDVSVDLERVGAVTADGRRLLVGPLAETGRPNRPRVAYVSPGGTLHSPIFTNAGELMVVEHRAGRSRLLKLTQDGPQPVMIGALRSQSLLSMALSPDGTRIVATVRDDTGDARVVLGQVRYDNAGTEVVGLSGVHDMVASGLALGSIHAVGWVDMTTIVVLGQVGEGTVRPYTVRIDGSQYLDRPLPIALPRWVDAVDLEASGIADSDIYVQDHRGRLWLGGTQRWDPIAERPLEAAAFPG